MHTVGRSSDLNGVPMEGFGRKSQDRLSNISMGADTILSKHQGFNMHEIGRLTFPFRCDRLLSSRLFRKYMECNIRCNSCGTVIVMD